MNKEEIENLLTMSLAQLKKEYDQYDNSDCTTSKKIRDFKRGKEILDDFSEFLNTDIDDDTKFALAAYVIYKLQTENSR